MLRQWQHLIKAKTEGSFLVCAINTKNAINNRKKENDKKSKK